MIVSITRKDGTVEFINGRTASVYPDLIVVYPHDYTAASIRIDPADLRHGATIHAFDIMPRMELGAKL